MGLATAVLVLAAPGALRSASRPAQLTSITSGAVHAVPCVDLPISGAVISPGSCWQTGPASFVLGGASPSNRSQGEVAVIDGQGQQGTSLSGWGSVKITSAGTASACAEGSAGSLHQVALSTGRVNLAPTSNCRGSSVGSSGASHDGPTPAQLTASSNASTAAATSLPPPMVPSYYEYYAYHSSCTSSSDPACPLYKQGQATYTPSSGGLVVLDFGAPCFVPGTSTYGAQLFGGAVCVPDSTIVQLAANWVHGYESDHGPGTSNLTLAVGTSNSLNGVDPGYALTSAQMTASGGAWYQSVVAKLPTGGLAAPITAWGASDMEQSSSGNWYSGAPTVAWVTGYDSASPAQYSCALNSSGFLADYGDDILGGSGSADGWTVSQVYQVAWGLPSACAVPEIYYTTQVPEWVALSKWGAANSTAGPILFTAVMTEAVGGSLSPAQGWTDLQQASGQNPPIAASTEIGTSLLGQPPQVSGVAPNEGPVAGGTDITISGKNLLGTQAVYFGTSPATSFAVVNAASVTAVCPPGVAGLAPVAVETSLGTSSTNSQAAYFYLGNGAYTPLTPARIEDTRSASGYPGGGRPPGPGGVVTVQVTGAGGVPSSGVSAVMVNLTVTQPTTSGFVTAFPTGTPVPATSNLDFSAGQTKANLVTVAVGAGGAISIFNHAGTTQVIVDVEGWFGETAYASGPGLFTPINPERVADTRSGSGQPYSGHELGPGTYLNVQVAGVGAIPTSGVAAVVLNLTATDPTASSYLTAYPAGGALPLASNVNFAPGQTICNQVVVPVGSDGQIAVYNHQGNVQVVADVSGWYGAAGGGSNLFSLPPTRSVDTRTNSGLPYAGQTLAPDSALTVQLGGAAGVPATGATGVVVNVTVTNATGAGYLQVWPTGQPQPFTSEINWTPGETTENLVLIALGGGGEVSIYNGSPGRVDVIVDVYAWFGAG